MLDREKVWNDLRNARTLINDGYNERGTTLTGDRCKYCVNAIDAAIIKLKEQEPVEPKKVKGYNPPMYTFYEYECEKCKSPMLNKQPFCMGCGRPVKWDA